MITNYSYIIQNFSGLKYTILLDSLHLRDCCFWSHGPHDFVLKKCLWCSLWGSNPLWLSLSLMVIEVYTSIKLETILNIASDSIIATNLRSEHQLKYVKDPICLILHLKMDFLINKSALEHAYFSTCYYCVLLLAAVTYVGFACN